MDKKLVAQSLKRAQELMTDDNFNQKVSNFSRNVTENTQYVPKQRTQTAQPQYSANQDPLAYNGLSSAASKMPKNILESMLENPIDVTQGVKSSVLDDFGLDVVPQQTVPQRQIVSEQMVSPSVVAVPNNSIDYNYIKYLIDESIKSNLQALQGNLLTESTMSGLKVKQNGTLVFVDTKGNIYEAKLTLKKKAEK